MFNLISKKTIGTTGVTLALLVGGLLASPVSSAFARPLEFEPLTRKGVMEETGHNYNGSQVYQVYGVAQYPFFTAADEPLGLIAIRRIDKK
jgi:hypothetical protein